MFLDLKNISVIIFLLFISIIAITYTAPPDPNYNDWRRYFLLYTAYITIIYNTYTLSVKIYLINDEQIKLEESVLSLLINIIFIILSFVLISYLDQQETCFLADDWKKNTILVISSIVLSLIIIAIGFLIYYYSNKQKIKLTPEQKIARTI